MKKHGLLKRLLQRIFFWRNMNTLSRVSTRAVNSPTHCTTLSDKECESIKDFCYEYERRVRESNDRKKQQGD